MDLTKFCGDEAFFVSIVYIIPAMAECYCNILEKQKKFIKKRMLGFKFMPKCCKKQKQVAKFCQTFFCFTFIIYISSHEYNTD